MDDKVVLITGAGAGIGRATALAFSGLGARVVVADIDQEPVEETARLVRETGGEALAVTLDVASADQVDAMVAQTMEKFGRLDCAFNNAGIEGVAATADAYKEEDWDRLMAVNLKGVWLCMRAELREMLKQGSGAIVNCSSIAGLVGFPSTPAYTASKHGVVGLTRAAALDYARKGIRVNAVCPGVIDTEMIDRFTHGSEEAEAQLAESEPVGRMGTPEEIANAVVWLCSDGASFVTGQALAVDGGFIAR